MLRTLLKVLGIYWIYGKWLLHTVKKNPMPSHIALILDGNRRWAKIKNVLPWIGHNEGAKVVENLLDWCKELGIKTVTLYALSTENLNRDEEEVKKLFDLLKQKLEQVVVDKRVHENKIRVSVIGRKRMLPEEVREAAKKAEDATKDYDKYFLNIAIAYGGRAEIVDAIRLLAKKVKSGHIQPDEIDETIVEAHLYTSIIPDSDPDLIIRTSGEERISNFLLWQSAYSELVFLDILWPDFRKIDLLRAIRIWQGRKRRFGL